jgi:activating signal cointegrator complex subunit 3
MLRVFSQYPTEKVLYIAPLKALVRERIKDWGCGLCTSLNKTMAELTGDFTPDLAALLATDVIICTPEKWDGISRNWQSRGYVQRVRLVIMDEIHLLGTDRGHVLEVIVSRMRYIAESTGRPIRFVGLSTALANAHDLSSWLGIRPQVRLCLLSACMPAHCAPCCYECCLCCLTTRATIVWPAAML